MDMEIYPSDCDLRDRSSDVALLFEDTISLQVCLDVGIQASMR